MVLGGVEAHADGFDVPENRTRQHFRDKRRRRSRIVW
jgi:hypothetical protein